MGKRTPVTRSGKAGARRSQPKRVQKHLPPNGSPCNLIVEFQAAVASLRAESVQKQPRRKEKSALYYELMGRASPKKPNHRTEITALTKKKATRADDTRQPVRGDRRA